MEIVAIAVGCIGAEGPWVGFAPTLDDAYEIVVGGTEAGSRRSPVESDDLLSLAIAYFDESLEEPPEDLAATHADIGALVRHIAEHEPDAQRRRLLGEAVDAVDDGLSADAVVRCLTRCLRETEDPAARIRRLALKLAAS